MTPVAATLPVCDKHQHQSPGVAIDDRSGEQAEDQVWRHADCEHGAEQERRTGEFDDQDGSRHLVQPPGGGAKEDGQPENAVIARGEGGEHARLAPPEERLARSVFLGAL